MQPPKNASTAIKTNTKIKSTAAKKNKETEEKTNVTSTNVEAATIVEETETKRTRTKATTKKAGTDVDEEPKAKQKDDRKKEQLLKSVESLEVPAAKRKD